MDATLVSPLTATGVVGPGGECWRPTVGRLSLDKQFHGELEASSKGQMLAVSRHGSACGVRGRRSLAPGGRLAGRRQPEVPRMA